MRVRVAVAIAVIAYAASGAVHADVRSEEKSLVRFEGALGRVVNFFGGKATKDGIVSTVAVRGDRKVTMNDSTGQIVDLREEKVYDLDLRKKTYTVTTFAEMRKQMEEARRKAAEQAASEEPEMSNKSDPDERPEVEIDFDLKESGQRRVVNGFDAREVVMTVVAREKGKTLEQAGGLVMTTNTWLAAQVPGLSEVAAFDRRYAEKLHGPMLFDAQQMAAMMAMYPMLQAAMARMQKENVNLDGTALLTVLKVEAVKNPEQQASAADEPSPASAGLGGLGGRLARRMMRKNTDEAATSAPGRVTVMTMQHEVLKVTSAVADAELAIPAGFTQR